MISQQDDTTPVPHDGLAVTITEATRALIAQVAIWARDGKQSTSTTVFIDVASKTATLAGGALGRQK